MTDRSIRKCSQAVKRFALRIGGQVQGVGFRPYVRNLAVELGLAGTIENDAAGVRITIQGNDAAIGAFLERLQRHPPPLAEIHSLTLNEVPSVDEGGFRILASRVTESITAWAPPDVSVCSDCLAELRDPSNRRYRYPFINCTHCGPRFTIITELPYDRERTTMASFVMCEDCRSEYEAPDQRRYHAQPIACSKCGPHLRFIAASAGPSPTHPVQESTEPTLEAFRVAMENGEVIAVKGIGGFHLACAADDPAAVKRLRQRKGRGEKPLAIMVRDIAQAESFAFIRRVEHRTLESPQRPVVLLEKKECERWRSLLESVAPGIGVVGVMLPYSPLHQLLVEQYSPLVMTSGNLADEPIVRTEGEATRRLAGVVDGMITHDRDIHVVCDDSVVRCMGDAVLPIRRSRGYAPLPLKWDREGPSVLAVGGDLKAAFCITKGRHAFLGQHLGDAGAIETLDALQRNVEHLVELYDVTLAAVAGDLHPAYLSRQWAIEYADRLGVPLIGVQHHQAHAAALIAERALEPGKRLLAFCFDGTGYGLDGSIWGGEVFLCDGRNFQRVAHLDRAPFPGAVASIRRPYRMALSLLQHCGMTWDQRLPCVQQCPHAERRILQRQLLRTSAAERTSSVGRLFDAIASLIGIRHLASFEAQAAMELESAAATAMEQADRDAYGFELREQAPIKIGYEPLLRAVVRDVISGVDPPLIAAQFHHAVACIICQLCERMRLETDCNRIGMTGGVFQNTLLAGLARERLIESGFDVQVHQIVPPNDGGLALGQAYIAQAYISETRVERRPSA